jgi:hypothetical protein
VGDATHQSQKRAAAHRRCVNVLLAQYVLDCHSKGGLLNPSPYRLSQNPAEAFGSTAKHDPTTTTTTTTTAAGGGGGDDMAGMDRGRSLHLTALPASPPPLDVDAYKVGRGSKCEPPDGTGPVQCPSSHAHWIDSPFTARATRASVIDTLIFALLCVAELPCLDA